MVQFQLRWGNKKPYISWSKQRRSLESAEQRKWNKQYASTSLKSSRVISLSLQPTHWNTNLLVFHFSISIFVELKVTLSDDLAHCHIWQSDCQNNEYMICHTFLKTFQVILLWKFLTSLAFWRGDVWAEAVQLLNWLYWERIDPSSSGTEVSHLTIQFDKVNYFSLNKVSEVTDHSHFQLYSSFIF